MNPTILPVCTIIISIHLLGLIGLIGDFHFFGELAIARKLLSLSERDIHFCLIV